MIEVEKKFVLTSQTYEKLVKHGIFVSKKIMKDSYYDFSDHRLTSNNIWLRNRNGKFELKIAVGWVKGKNRVDTYKEVEDSEKIAKFLHFSKSLTHENLLKEGYLPCISYTTNREKYTFGEITLDIDETDFGYKLAEVEIMVQKKSDIARANTRIRDFALKYGLAVSDTKGKIEVYLERFDKAYFQELLKEGIF